MRAIVASLSVAVALATGCASRLPAPVPPPAEIRTAGADPAPAWLQKPLVVSDGGPLELLGPEFRSEAREKFLRDRAERIRGAGYVTGVAYGPGNLLEACAKVALGVPIIGLAACPFVIVTMVGGIEGTRAITGGVRRAKAAKREPLLQVSQEDAARLSSALLAGASSEALVERVTRFAGNRAAQNAREAQSLLVIRVKSARACDLRSWAALCLVAEAQGALADGVPLAPTEHTLMRAPIAALDDDDIQEALDMLVESIVATYIVDSGERDRLIESIAYR